MKNRKMLKFVTLFSVLLLLSLTVFAQVDVPRQTTAITYPVDETVYLQFRGTTRFPRMKGEAKIRRTKKNGTEINLSVSKMPRPFELGVGYATYVLWAISPEGQVDNLGEIKRRGFWEFDSSMSVTTPLQSFALIVTAEPHFLVRRPSRAIMLENLNPSAKSGRTLATTTAIQYFGNSSDYFSDARTPEIAELDYSKTPSTILQAKQALALAKYAGAQRDAVEELNEAQTLTDNAEKAWQAGRAEADVDIVARRAIGAAVKAETTAAARKQSREQRNEKSRQDADLRVQEEKVQDAQSEIASLKSELARETNNRQLAERDALNYSNQVKELRDQNAQLQKDVESAKIKLANIEGQNKALQEQRERDQKLSRLQDNMPVLMESLKRFGSVSQNERGIVLVLPENYWTGIRDSGLAQTGEDNLNSLSQVLANSTDYKVVIESHTDNKGTPEELQLLTDHRAQAIADKIKTFGVTPDRIETKGYGASLPVAPNTTNANRAKNRRVQIILTPMI